MWTLLTTDTFDLWFDALSDEDRTRVLASMLVLQKQGPALSRPHADSVKGSFYRNMKELRIQSQGKPLRAFFAFDPERKGILLCAGNKQGKGKSFYKEMLTLADKEFSAYLMRLNKKGQHHGKNT